VPAPQIYRHLPAHLAQALAQLPPLPSYGRGRGRGRGQQLPVMPMPALPLPGPVLNVGSIYFVFNLYNNNYHYSFCLNLKLQFLRLESQLCI
jgi:hypothetical protein